MGPLSLRRTFATVTIVLTVVALAATSGLIALATLSHSATENVTARVESVRLAQAAEIDLLLVERVEDPVVKRNYASRLDKRLRALEEQPVTPEGKATLSDALVSTRSYLDALAEGAAPAVLNSRHGAAFSALEALINVKVAGARITERRAERFDAMAYGLALGVAVLGLVVSASALAWLRSRAFRPAYDLAAAMQRFGNGSLDARAPVAGAAELAEMAQRFNAMAEALVARRRAQIAFVGGVAHDLRGPLTALRFSLDALNPQRALPPEPRIRISAERSLRSVTLLERMIRDFLDVSRIDAGELELQRDVHDIAAIARETVGLFAMSSPRHRVRLDVPGRFTALTRCDAVRMQQVLANLVSNAVKYSPDGGDVLVSVRREPSDVGPMVIVEVRDEGIGIAEEDQSRLFEPFRRVGLSKETIPGVGLGLYIVKHIVVAHGGSIEVESILGTGTTMRVILPGLGEADGKDGKADDEGGDDDGARASDTTH